MLLLGAILLAIFWIGSPLDWILVGLAAAFEVGELAFWLWWNRRRRVQVGAEMLIGRPGVVVVPCRPEGQVRVDGELWQARCAAGAGFGERVRVVGRDRLTLVVEPERQPERVEPRAGLDSPS